MKIINDLRNKKIKPISIMISFFFFLIPFDTLQIAGGFSVLKCFAVVLTVVSLFFQKRSRFYLCRTMIVLFVLSLFILMQLLFTEYFSSVLNTFITVALYTVMITLLAQIPYTQEEKMLFIKSFCYMSVLCVALTVFFPFDYEGRLTICFPQMRREDPNQFAGYMIPGIIYFLDRTLRKGKYRMICFLIALVLLYYILLTGSRGALLATILGSVCLIAIHGKFFEKNRFVGFLKMAAIILFVILAYEIVLSFLPDELVARFDLFEAVASGGTGRSDIWHNYLDYYSNAGLFVKAFGIGAGSITSIYGMVAHNTWIEMLVCTGLVGLLIFLMLNYSILRSFIRTKEYLLLSIFVALIGLTMSLSLLAYKPIWAVALLSLIVTKTHRGSSETELIQGSEHER